MVFHPREGWSEGGVRRPRDDAGMSRRDFLSAAGSGAAALGLGGLLAACGGTAKGSTGTGGTNAGNGGIPLARPGSPVKWPIYSDNKPIASNLAIEEGADLQVYNWVAYINPQVIKDFEKKFKCKVTVTTFNTMSEALSKLATHEIPFDVFFPTIDVLGPLIETKVISPMNHSYVPNIVNAWPEFTNPFYDQAWQYTVPYTIYTTGIAWRKDHVDINPYQLANGWDMPWMGAKYKGKVAILDDYREGISLGLLRNGVYDLNTTDTSKVAASLQALQELQSATAVQIDNNDYTNLPGGKIWIHHAWSGDIASAANYMQKGVSVDVVGYWFPTDGRGPVANDLISLVNGGKYPVLAHTFINYMLGVNTVFENISWNGYMQPLSAVTPQALVSQQILPPSLMSTAVVPSYFDRGIMELEIDAAATANWE
ncbi:MAG TPA: spermidine/putrescine ABC transporter substrate-binding protein [Acidimicrobiales bacterium]|nr:spermidine/putrescine ABC transporter substrate-binding protein [Acidimicrobiales bacterium]